MKFREWSFFCVVFSVWALSLAGCGPQKEDDSAEQTAVSNDVTLNILVVDAPSIATNAGRRWSAEALGEANFTAMTAAELTASDFKLDSSVDVVIYPVEYMANLIAGAQLMPIPKKFLDNDTTSRKEMLPHQQKFLQRYGADVYTLPLGDVYLMLVYNQKIFSELELEVPGTWQEYGEVAKKLRAAGHVVQEPFADGWAGRLLLSRAAANVRSRGKVSTVFEMNSMKPLIDGEPFPRVLGELAEALGDSIDTDLSPGDVYTNLLQGKAAMGLTWPSKHFADEDVPSNQDLAIARMPGAKDWYNRSESKWEERDKEASIHMPLLGSSGMVVSVNKTSAYATSAIDFATWVCSKPTSTSVSIESPRVSMFRATHLGQPARWAGDKISAAAVDQFGEVFREISESQIVFLFPRIPGQAEYLQALDRQVIEFAKGDKTAEEALSETIENWNEITNHWDRDAQIKMLRRSEGFSN